MTVRKSGKLPIRLMSPSRVSELHYLPPPTPKNSPFTYRGVYGSLYPKVSPYRKTPTAPRMTPMYDIPPPRVTHNWSPRRSPVLAQINTHSPRMSPVIASLNVAGIAKTLHTSPQQVKSLVNNIVSGDLVRDNVEKRVLSEDQTKRELALKMSVLSNVPKTDQALVLKIMDGVQDTNPGVWSNILSGFKNNKFYAMALGAAIIAAGVYVKYAYFSTPETWTEMIIRYLIQSFYGKPAYSLYRLGATIDMVKKNSREIVEKVTAPFKRLLGIYTAPPELSKIDKAIKYGRAVSWLLLMVNSEFMGFHQLLFGTAAGASYAVGGPIGGIVERIFGGRRTKRTLRKNNKKRPQRLYR